MIFNILVFDIKLVIHCIEEVRFALFRKWQLKCAHKLHKGTVSIVGENLHIIRVFIKSGFFDGYNLWLLRWRIQNKILFLWLQSVHSVLVIVYFKFLRVLCSKVTNNKFLIFMFNLHQNKDKFTRLNCFWKLFKLKRRLNVVCGLSLIDSIPFFTIGCF